jgi:hypothetical protein
VEKLSLILWRERELLETLLFKLEEEQLLLSSGRTRWLMRAAKEVESVLQSIRETEILRSVAADEAAASIGMATSPSLRALADAVDEPWRTILVEHRDAFVAITSEISALADSNRELVTAGYRSARETLMTLGDGSAGYSPDGSALAGTPRHLLVDRSL